jgi:hypothetical protein
MENPTIFATYHFQESPRPSPLHEGQVLAQVAHEAAFHQAVVLLSQPWLLLQQERQEIRI